MPDVLLTALTGAAIAFLGTSLLQRAQFRRADLEGVRERLGLPRALRADLLVAKLACESALNREVITPGARFPVDIYRNVLVRLNSATVRLGRPALELVISRAEWPSLAALAPCLRRSSPACQWSRRP